MGEGAEKDGLPSESTAESKAKSIQNQIEEMEAQYTPDSDRLKADEIENNSFDRESDVEAPALVQTRVDPNGNDSVGLESNEGGRIEDEQLEAAEVSQRSVSGNSVVLSSLMSLALVLLLLVAVRLFLPPLLESSRYSWMRGQLRAEFEVSGAELKKVSLDGLSQVSQLVSKRASPSVVHIMVRTKSNFLEELRRQGMNDRVLFNQDSQGSGVIVDSDGFLLTNEHVVRDADELFVRLSDGRLVEGSVVGVDALTDLAVVKIDAKRLFAIDWGDSQGIEVGSPVWALGSPFGLTGSITFGILSGKDRMNLSGTSYMGSSLQDQARYGNLMQSDVAVNPGNSGGPLVNARGELIGVNTAIVGESYRGVSFAIPSNIARRVFESIKSGQPVPRGWLGVAMIEMPVPESEDGSVQVFVQGFGSSDSPALSAGIRSGDRIVSIAGEEIRSMKDVAQMVEQLTPGMQYPIVVERDGAELRLEVLIGQLQVTE